MASRKITNNSILLFLGEDPDELDTVVCLIKVGNDFTIDELNATTICGSSKMAGEVSGNISIDGQHWLEPETGKVSGHNLFEWAMSRTPLYYKIAPAVPVDGDVIQEGQCVITSLGNNYSYNAQSSFSCNLAINGIPTETITNIADRVLAETGYFILAETGDFILSE